jgi:hypothetical protein
MKTKISILTLLFVTSIFISSCGIFGKTKKSQWSEVEREAFMGACVEGLAGTPGIDAKDYCNCMLEKLEEKYPSAMDAQNMDENLMQEWAVECLQGDKKKKK